MHEHDLDLHTGDATRILAALRAQDAAWDWEPTPRLDEFTNPGQIVAADDQTAAQGPFITELPHESSPLPRIDRDHFRRPFPLRFMLDEIDREGPLLPTHTNTFMIDQGRQAAPAPKGKELPLPTNARLRAFNDRRLLAIGDEKLKAVSVGARAADQRDVAKDDLQAHLAELRGGNDHTAIAEGLGERHHLRGQASRSHTEYLAAVSAWVAADQAPRSLGDAILKIGGFVVDPDRSANPGIVAATAIESHRHLVERTIDFLDNLGKELPGASDSMVSITEV